MLAIFLFLTVFYCFRRAKEVAPPKQLQEEAEQMMEQLMTLVQYTAVSIFIYYKLDSKSFRIWVV